MGRLNSRLKCRVLFSAQSVALPLGMLLLTAFGGVGCRRTPATIAVIPRTCGTAM